MASTNAKIATTTTLKAASTSITYGTKLTLTALVTPTKATGQVTFYAGKVALGKSVLSGGSAKLTVSTLPVGSNAVKAVYPGSSTFATSTSKSVTIVVRKASTSLELTSSAPSGKTVFLIAKIYPLNVTGNVNFWADYPENPFWIGTGILKNGIAKVPTAPGMPTGKLPFTAVYQGSPDWATSTSNTLFVTIE